MLRSLAILLLVASLANTFQFAGKSSLLSHTRRMAVEGAVDFPTLDGSKARIGIIKTRWNKEDVSNLVNGCKKALKETGVDDANVFETEVPGAFELPYAARLLALSGTVDAVVCVGVLVKGDTMHFEYISDAVSSGIMNVGLQTAVPCVFGVLTCNTEEQVKARSTGKHNHGESWGQTAVEMALLRGEALGGAQKPSMGFGAPVEVGSTAKSSGPKIGF